jgi:hypothetical protein
LTKTRSFRDVTLSVCVPLIWSGLVPNRTFSFGAQSGKKSIILSQVAYSIVQSKAICRQMSDWSDTMSKRSVILTNLLWTHAIRQLSKDDYGRIATHPVFVSCPMMKRATWTRKSLVTNFQA